MKKVILPLLLIICLLALSACSSSAPGDRFGVMENAAPAPAAAPSPTAPEVSDNSYDTSADGMNTVAIEVSGGGYESASGLPAGVEARKVVYSAEFRLDTEDFAATMRRLDQKIAVSGSYIQQSDSRAATEYSTAYASLTIRVPAAMYGDFKSFLTDLAVISSSVEHGEDVTAQYFDTEARLKVLQAQEERIKTFIANSKDLDEIFKIERELTRISTEIEQLTTVKNRLDNLTAYATVYVEVREIADDKLIGPEPASFGERVNQALAGSLKGLVTAVQSLALLVIWIWPLLALAAIAILVWRKFGRRRPRGKINPPSAPKEREKEE